MSDMYNTDTYIWASYLDVFHRCLRETGTIFLTYVKDLFQDKINCTL